MFGSSLCFTVLLSGSCASLLETHCCHWLIFLGKWLALKQWFVVLPHLTIPLWVAEQLSKVLWAKTWNERRTDWVTGVMTHWAMAFGGSHSLHSFEPRVRRYFLQWFVVPSCGAYPSVLISVHILIALSLCMKIENSTFHSEAERWRGKEMCLRCWVSASHPEQYWHLETEY